MSLRIKTILAISLIMLLMSCVFFYITYFFASENIAKLIKNNQNTIESVVRHTVMHNHKVYSARLRGFVTTNNLITKAMSEKDLPTLQSALTKRVSVLRNENSAFEGITLVAPDYKVILRTIFKNRDDDVSHIPSIKKAMETKTLIHGINITKGGVKYTMVSPAYYEDKFIGLVVFILNMGIFEQHLKNLSETYFGIFADVTNVNRYAYKPVKNSDKYILIDANKPEIMSKFVSFFETMQQSSIINMDGDRYIYHKVPLYDFQQNPIAYILAINDITADYNVFKSTLIKTSILILLLLGIGVLVIYYSLGKLLKKLNEETEQKQNNEQLLFQQSKFVDMGKMVSAIAHQWRQPLNTLGILAQDMADAKEYGELSSEYVDNNVSQIMQLITHMSDTIDNFRDFYITNEASEVFCATNEIQKVFSLFSARLAHNDISFSVKVHQQTFTDTDLNEHETICNGKHYDIKCNQGEFKQVILNLIGNAIDVLSTSATKELNIEIETARNNLLIIIEDTGGGIPVDIIDKIFEPYFTTKLETGGTGIGLYLCKLIIEQKMSGSITAENTAAGAKFTVSIPLFSRQSL